MHHLTKEKATLNKPVLKILPKDFAIDIYNASLKSYIYIIKRIIEFTALI